MFLKVIFSAFSIFLAGIIALIRFKKIDNIYRPMIFLIWLGCINEILSYCLFKNNISTAINNNVYVLTEAVLLLFLFRNFGIFNKLQWLFWSICWALALLWLWENFIHSKIWYISSWFRIVSSFLIVLVSIDAISKLMILGSEEFFIIKGRSLFANAAFLICIGTIIFFTFKLLVEIFWLYGLNGSEIFRVKLYDILTYINLSVNLIYALAVLWAQPKQQYIMLSSLLRS
jgi:hypothetical protein